MAGLKEPTDRKLLAIAFALSLLATRPMLAQSPPRASSPAVASASTQLGDQTPAAKLPPNKNSVDKSAAEKTSAEKTSAEKSTAEKSTADKSTGEKNSGDKSSDDKTSADKTSAEKSTADKSTGEKNSGDKTSVDKTSADKSPADKSPADKSSDEKSSAEKSSDDKSSAAQAATANTTLSKTALGKAAAGKTALSEPAAGKSVKERPTALQMHIEDLPAPTPRSSRREAIAAVGSSAAGGVIPAAANRVLDVIQFDDITLAEAMRLFAEQSGLNVITSSEAGKTKITVFLKGVTALNALEAIVRANGLFYRIEENSGIVRIATSKEYEKDLASFREEETRVFTLLYPNPSAVAQVIQQVFGNRVQMSRADADVEDLVDLSRRFSRFDLVDGRSLGLGSPNAGRNSSSQRGSSGMGGANGLGRNGMLGGLGMAGMGGMAGMNGMAGMGQQGMMPGMSMQAMALRGSAQAANAQKEHTPLDDMSAEEIQEIENQVAQNGQLGDDERADLLQRKEATIYVSTIRRNNQVIVRTGDSRSMDQIAQLIAQLDVPTPTVLLEVKVMRIILADGFNSAFEYLGNSGNSAVASSDSLAPAFPGASSVARSLGSGLGVAGSVPGALTFQVVDHNFHVRMQLLQSKNCVTALATPLILTANNEVSRIFVGDTLPFTVGFTPSQVLSSIGAVNGAVAATPITELRDVGQSLLITPNINADRTVTLRVVEENSERVLAGSSIPVPSTSGTGVTNVSVDTVRRRTISGTIVAQDGMAVALGGLIEENVSEARDQVPVLGNIPGLGMLFRRQASNRSRSELVVIVRPYVFNTPSESAATSELLLGELSTHPASPGAGKKALNLPCRVTRSDAECVQRAKLFHLHNGATPSF